MLGAVPEMAKQSKTSPSSRPKRQRKSTSVPGTYLGFAVQATRFLAHLLTAEPGDAVCLEVFDDVGVEQADGVTVAEQVERAHAPAILCLIGPFNFGQRSVIGSTLPANPAFSTRRRRISSFTSQGGQQVILRLRSMMRRHWTTQGWPFERLRRPFSCRWFPTSGTRSVPSTSI